jgi:hypothetical protein
MADEPAAISTLATTNGHTTTSTVPRPAPPPSAAPQPAPVQHQAPATDQQVPRDRTAAAPPSDPRAPDPTPAGAPAPENAYRANPALLPEHALLGSLLHAPDALTELENFLGVRDFSTPDTRAVYATLRGLHRAGALYDIASLSTDAARLAAANENHVKLLRALTAQPPTFTTIRASGPKIITKLAAAAPVEGLTFRGVYDPGAQMRLGRTVVEDSIRRQITAMGVRIRRTRPTLTRRARTATTRRTIRGLAGDLDGMTQHVAVLSARLAAAVQRTPPTQSTPDANSPRPPDRVQLSRPLRPADLWRPVSRAVRHRAERHLLHLAMHSARMTDIPDEILTLTPQDFTDPRHANTWRTIKDLTDRGIPPNYVAVFQEKGTTGFTHHPMLSDRALTTMATPPPTGQHRLGRTLRAVLGPALARTRHATASTLATLAAGPHTDAHTMLTRAATELTHLADRTRIATGPTPPSASSAPHGRHHR